MKRFLKFMLIAIMAVSMASCDSTVRPDEQEPVESQMSYMVWQPIDSVTSHINISDSSCITMTIEDSTVTLKTQGITELKVFSDTVELPVLKDSSTYTIDANDICGRPVSIQADSTEIDL